MSRPKLLRLILNCATLAITWAYFAHTYINHDTGWFMYAARGLLNGGHLYLDYVDVNAPMAYFTLIPAAWFSNFISNEAALTLNVLIYILAAYVLSVHVTKHLNLKPMQIAALDAAILFILCLMPNYAFGQREHFLVIFMMPYVLAAGFRIENRALPRWLAIGCGISCGIAVSIKLPYAIVPILIEAGILARQKTWKIGFTYDLLVAVVTTIIINLICFALYPIYWTGILPSAVALYGPYNNYRFLTDALMMQVPLFMVGFAMGQYRGKGTLIGSRWMMIFATLGAFALFIAQQKGWPHHALPILMFLATLSVFNLIDFKFKNFSKKIGPAFRASVTIIVIGVSFYLAWAGGNVDEDMIQGVEAQVKQTDGSFYILSTGNYPAFPLALNRNYHWISRFPQLIELPGLVAENRKGNISPYEPAFRAQVTEDLKKGKPATVFLFVPPDAGMPPNVDILMWFRHDPDFEREWSHYRQTGVSGPFAVFGRSVQ